MVSHPLRRPDRLDKINGEFVDRMGHPTTTLGSSSHLEYFLLFKNDSDGSVLYRVYIRDANNNQVLLDADVEKHRREKTLLALLKKLEKKKDKMPSRWNVFEKDG
jgi:hypothetical protein